MTPDHGSKTSAKGSRDQNQNADGFDPGRGGFENARNSPGPKGLMTLHIKRERKSNDPKLCQANPTKPSTDRVTDKSTFCGFVTHAPP